MLRNRPLVAAAAALLLVLGCSPLPLAPESSISNSDRAETHGLSEIQNPVGSASLFVEQMVSGLAGGQVRAGRVTLKVPRGAFVGLASISVSVPDTTQLRVELHVTGVPNAFQVPVDLELRWAGATWPLEEIDPNALSIFWLNEAVNQWERVPSTVDLANGTIRTPLSHFSVYDVHEIVEAKAGW